MGKLIIVPPPTATARKFQVVAAPFAKLSELSVGDTIKIGRGFCCCKAGSIREVKQRPSGSLYFDCVGGFHKLNEWEEGELVGITKVN